MRRPETERWVSWLIALALLTLTLAIYVSRIAPSVVPGDPGEYQVIASRWGIGHPPGYGLYALLGNVLTHLVPWGSFAWRANLLSAASGAAIVALAYGIGRLLVDEQLSAVSLRAQAPPILGALLVGTGLDLWQHAIHANAHIVTALVATVSLYCLLRWWRVGRDRWLYFFCVVAGLSPVQHPLLVFAFPAYALFVLCVRPRIWRHWRTLLAMVGCALLGLAAFAYYPIRSAIGAVPPPGPTDMHTWQGFVRVVTAQGLRVNLGGFSLGDLLWRLWDVRVPLRLHYALPALALAAAGLVALWAYRWRPALLLTGYVACIVFVTVNVLQDAMAYLLGPVVVVGVFAGLGVGAALLAVHRWRWAQLAVVGLVAMLPLWSLVRNWEGMDLSGWTDADAWLQGIEDRFVGRGEGAVLLTEWERMTTVYYYSAVEGRTWDDEDLEFVHVHAGTEAPFVDAADRYVPDRPVYLMTFRPKLAQGKYRLVPSGDLWRVVPVWPRTLPPEAQSTEILAEERFEIVGWHLDRSAAQPGEVLLLDLYMRIADPEGVEAQQYYLPWARLGETTYRFTLDSRFRTPWWQEGEIIVERFELPVPWHLADGTYPLQIGVEWINGGRDLQLDEGTTQTTLTEIEVLPADWQPSVRKLESALGNLRGEILLRTAWVNGRRASPEGDGMVLCPGQTLHVLLEWESLVPIEENYKVFVQLVDTPVPYLRAQGDDKAPLRGSAPTLLWFPRWRRGTAMPDKYELEVPGDLPPGDYALVVGMYGFSTGKRIQSVMPDGDVAGDWITVTHLHVR